MNVDYRRYINKDGSLDYKRLDVESIEGTLRNDDMSRRVDENGKEVNDNISLSTFREIKALLREEGYNVW